MSTIAKLLAKLELDTTGFTKGLASIPSALNSVGGSMTQVGSSITRGITLPLIAAGAGVVALSVKAIQLGTDFDREMRNIQSISRQTDGEIATLGQGFLEMSSNISMTTDSATALANAFYFIQSAGYSGADAQTILEVSTKAASAGLTDTNVAAKAILATLSAYGQGAQDAAHVSDVLFKTVDLGVITFDELSTQIGDVVNTAATLNVSIEEVGGAITEMTRKGISGAEAVTALNQLLLQFISPSQKMQDAAKAMGVDLSLDAIRTKGLQDALMDIEKIGGPNAMLTLFGDNVRALKAALSLTGENAADFNDIMQQMGDVTGRTNEAFAVQTQSLAAYKKNVQNVFTNLGIGFAEAIKPSLLNVGKQISDFVTANKPQLEGLFASLATVIAGFSENFGPWLEQNGPKLIEFLQKMITSLPEFVAKMGEIGSKIAPQIERLFNAFMNMDPGTIAGIMQAILGLAALGPVLSILGSLLITISSIITLAGSIGPVIAGIGTAIVTLAGWIASAATAIGAVITGGILLPLLVIIGTLALVTYAFATNFMGITTAVQQLWFIIQYYFGQIGAWIASTIQKAVDYAIARIAFLGQAAAKVKMDFDNAMAGIAGAIGRVIAKVLELAAALLKLALPKDLKPGSPTPFEIGLIGIADAMDRVNNTGLAGLTNPRTPAMSSAVSKGLMRSGDVNSDNSSRKVEINITNPKKETSEDSIRKTLNRLSYLRVLE